MQASDCWTVAYKSIVSGQEERAIAICKQVPCADVLECQRYLGWIYYQRNNWRMAVVWFTKAASRGDGDALFGMASAYFVQRDFQRALQYYERAASQGYARAYSWIAYIHHQGLGVPKNADLAIDFYRKAARHGFLVAERALIHLTFQRGGLLSKIAALPRFVYIVVKAGVLAFKNAHDPRISDVPNAFDKKSR